MGGRHEHLYGHTIDCIVADITEQRVLAGSVSQIVHDLRTELGQCMDLGLISTQFYQNRMTQLGNVVKKIDD